MTELATGAAAPAIDERPRSLPGPPDVVDGFSVADDEEREGAWLTFPFDRALLDRLREGFPRARWRRKEGRWFVPGKTAATRLAVFVAGELARLDRHADAKGRDAFAFDPLRSDYLTVADDLLVRTPYSRTVVATLREVPFARWDSSVRAWRVPFRSYEALRARWPVIEEAALRHEAGGGRKGDAASRLAAAERRRRRLAVPQTAPPPLGEPVATEAFGVVVFEALDSDPVPEEDVPPLHAGAARPLVWAHWRMPTWREVGAAEAALRRAIREGDADPSPDRSVGWWPPSTAELAERRRRMREGERARATRAAGAPQAA